MRNLCKLACTFFTRGHRLTSEEAQHQQHEFPIALGKHQHALHHFTTTGSRTAAAELQAPQMVRAVLQAHITCIEVPLFRQDIP